MFQNVIETNLKRFLCPIMHLNYSFHRPLYITCQPVHWSFELGTIWYFIRGTIIATHIYHHICHLLGHYVVTCVCLYVCMCVCVYVSVTKISQEWMMESGYIYSDSDHTVSRCITNVFICIIC